MDEYSRRIKQLAAGILLGLASIAYGFGLGVAFGFAEDGIKTHLAGRGEAVLATAYAGDRDELDRVLSKSWVYFKRAHLHANSLGTSAIAVALLLTLVGPVSRLARASALLFGAGALVYGLYWMFAGLLAPGLGGTGAAKETLWFLAIPGSGMCVLGLVGTVVCLVRQLLSGNET